jgi:hypothetical protein
LIDLPNRFVALGERVVVENVAVTSALRHLDFGENHVDHVELTDRRFDLARSFQITAAPQKVLRELLMAMGVTPNRFGNGWIGRSRSAAVQRSDAGSPRKIAHFL